MRVITQNELRHRSKRELDALYAWIFGEVLQAAHGSPEWQTGMQTLENIRCEQRSRPSAPKPRGPCPRR
jgi:hypothetical protein